MSVTETCMIESDPALVLSAGITDPEQVNQLCADFFAREKEKEASYKKLPGLDLPYIYIAMMAGVPEVELEKGIPGPEPSEETPSHEEVPGDKSTHKEHSPHPPKQTHSPHNSPRREQDKKRDSGRRQHYSGVKKEASYSHHISPPQYHSSSHSSRSQPPSHSPLGGGYPAQESHHRRHVNSNEMHPSSMTGHIPMMDHPHMSHGPYTSISQPPPIYHHGIPAPDLSAQQHMHSQYKDPAFQLSGDLYHSPTSYPFKLNSASNSSMDPHAPKFSMGGRHGHKRPNYYPMHHDLGSQMMGSKATDFYPDVSHLANYNAGLPFSPNQKQTKFFILTSTVEENIFQSIRYGVWSSTSRGNKTIQAAINDGNSVILFYGAARLDYMYGCAEMKSSVDFEALTGLWHDDNWKGKFQVKWFYLKNVPKMHFARISEYSNPFRMCRDGMEVPWDIAKRALDIFRGFKARESLLDKSIEFRPKLLHKTLRC